MALGIDVGAIEHVACIHTGTRGASVSENAVQ